MFSLIERFYQPITGEILFGNEPIMNYSLRSWCEILGYVSQDSLIYSGTIQENIIHGLGEAISQEKITAAAEMAYAHEFIQDLPNGYQTEVGERGIRDFQVDNGNELRLQEH
jgi:ATP-binding cassette, subfamily B, bacterial AbcA/BmrA